jgi:hypothetical protein
MEQQQFKVSFSVGTKLLISVVLLLFIVIIFLNTSTILLLKEDKRAYTYKSQASETVMAGREFVIQNYTWDIIAGRVEKVIDMMPVNEENHWAAPFISHTPNLSKINNRILSIENWVREVHKEVTNRPWTIKSEAIKHYCQQLKEGRINENDFVQECTNGEVYFNGIELGKDCHCCGDRWHSVNKSGIYSMGKDGEKLYLPYPRSINSNENYYLIEEILGKEIQLSLGPWKEDVIHVYMKDGEHRMYSQTRIENNIYIFNRQI